MRSRWTTLPLLAALAVASLPAAAVHAEPVGPPTSVVVASTAPDGPKANGRSWAPSLSASGTVVAFASTADNLSDADGDAFSDVYVKDLDSGAVTLASARADGIKGDGPSGMPSLSADGATVAFASSAANLRPDDGPERSDIHVKNLVTGALVLASSTDDGTPLTEGSFDPAVSADGTHVAFTTRDGAVRVKDLSTGGLLVVPQLSTGPLSLSGDGSHVAGWGKVEGGGSWFPLQPIVVDLATGRVVRRFAPVEIVPAGLALSMGGETVGFTGGSSSGGLSFGRLCLGDVAAGTQRCVEPPSPGLPSGVALTVTLPDIDALSADASRLSATFRLIAGAEPSDPDPLNFSRVYVQDTTTGQAVFPAQGPGGLASDGMSMDSSLDAAGDTVAFASTATTLHPADTDPEVDVYVVELAGEDRRCTISGSDGDDVLEGTAGHDVICAEGGNDVVRAGAGDDVVYAGDGDDVVHGGDGDDAVHAEAGDDLVYGMNGHDRLAGGPGADRLQGDAGLDRVHGGAGDDGVWGGEADDVVRGGPGTDDVRGGTGRDALLGGAGDDAVHGDAGDDTVVGGPGDDAVHGNSGDDVLGGGRGTDVCNGGAGSDVARATWEVVRNV